MDANQITIDISVNKDQFAQLVEQNKEHIFFKWIFAGRMEAKGIENAS